MPTNDHRQNCVQPYASDVLDCWRVLDCVACRFPKTDLHFSVCHVRSIGGGETRVHFSKSRGICVRYAPFCYAGYDSPHRTYRSVLYHIKRQKQSRVAVLHCITNIAKTSMCYVSNTALFNNLIKYPDIQML